MQHDGAAVRRLARLLGDPRAQVRLRQSLQHLSRAHTVPSLVGSSQDAHTLYIDSALPARLLISGGMVPLYGTLITHERVLRALMDGVGLSADGAHGLAQSGTAMRVRSSGVAWRDWAQALAAYMRQPADLTSAPPDLDLRPHEGREEHGTLEGAQRAARVRTPPATPDHLHVGAMQP